MPTLIKRGRYDPWRKAECDRCGAQYQYQDRETGDSNRMVFGCDCCGKLIAVTRGEGEEIAKQTDLERLDLNLRALHRN